MTGYELRQKVCRIMTGWVGATKGSSLQADILRTYNGYTPLPRGYAVQPYDAYCATTVSAAWIRAGMAGFAVIECSVPRMIELAQDKGIWVEDDSYRPQLGDAVCYDWSDGANFASTDNRGSGDHIGIVTEISGSVMTVTEGNMSGGRTGSRQLHVNGRYIRGFICPDYDGAARAISGEAEAAGKVLEVYDSWKTYTAGDAEETVYKDTDFTEPTGSLNPGESCWCTGRYGDAYAVIYRKDGFEDRWCIGYVRKVGSLR